MIYEDIDDDPVVPPIELFDELDDVPDETDVRMGLAIPTGYKSKGDGRATSCGPGQRDADLARIADIERRRLEREHIDRLRIAVSHARRGDVS